MEENPNRQQNNNNDILDMGLATLVIAKKMNLSFDEVNELRIRDLFKMADIYCGEEPPAIREATQEDIDRLYGG